MSKPPAYRPQLATLVDAPPEGDEYLHELKLDGYRIGCTLHRGEVRLETRRGNDWTDSFRPVAAAAERLHAKSALLDGEVAALMSNGITSFQALHDPEAVNAKLVYFVFDLLYLDGEDVAALPLERRKQRLHELLQSSRVEDVIKYTDHVVGDGARVFERACALGAEGIVSKLKDGAYRSGRNTSWLKVKCVKRQELIVVGFTDPEGSRAGIGALLLGYYADKGTLVFAGKVGTGKGFTREYLVGLRAQLEPLIAKQSPLAAPLKGVRLSGVHWVRPELVVEVQFVEWTGDGRLRHPSLVAVRNDKPASEVVREVPDARAGSR